MQTLEFTLNQEALNGWNSDVGELWDPRNYGEQHTVLNLVEGAQYEGIITWPFGDVLKARIAYCHGDENEDGVGYIWTLSLERADTPRLRLASNWGEQRKIVPDGVLGKGAVRSILEEAVEVANRLLRDYTAWLGIDASFKLVIIRHRHGENYHLLTDEESARDEIHAYVSDWWHNDGPEGPMPADRGEAIDAYFAHSGEDYSIDDVAVMGPHVAARPPEPDLPAARNAIIEAGRLLETAVRTAVASKVKAVYPSAAVLEAEGLYNEVGLLHLYTRRILDANGGVLDGQEDPSDDWDELTDEVDPMLWEISERFDEYAGTHSFDLA